MITLLSIGKRLLILLRHAMLPFQGEVASTTLKYIIARPIDLNKEVDSPTDLET